MAKPGIHAADWQPAFELGPAGAGPWNLERKFAQVLSGASLAGHVRSSLVAADPLMTALGGPNREQVMTARASAATTFQALELTNGKTLAEQLKQGSEKLLRGPHCQRAELVSTLFERALARPPKPEELELSQQWWGRRRAKRESRIFSGRVAMLPEFPDLILLPEHRFHGRPAPKWRCLELLHLSVYSNAYEIRFPA